MTLTEVVEELQDFVLAPAVEIAGRLIGQQERRLVGQGPGDGDALALADRKVHRTVVPAMSQADLVDQPLRALDSLPAAQGGLEHGNLHVLDRSQGAQDMKGLEDEPDLPGAVLVTVDPRQGRASEVDLACGGPIESAQQMQQACSCRIRWAR